jgi:GH24 family phage-related lysozyme (muramidase)
VTTTTNLDISLVDPSQVQKEVTINQAFTCFDAMIGSSVADALVSFTYNLGAAALQRSRLRRVINRGEHASAPREFERWVWAAGHKLPGLVRRRHAEGMLYSIN